MNPQQPGRRRRAACLSAAGALMICAALLPIAASPCRAASAEAERSDLLDTLYKKQILTQEEYEQLKQEDSKFDKFLQVLGGLQIGTLSYFEYTGGEQNDESFHQFRLTRGYINIKMRVTSWLGFRVTPDAHQDSTGDFKLRLKYLYAEFAPPDLSLFTDLRSEVGIGHMPWLDFEEHINPYRCQGTMFIERAGIFNSADLGVGLRGYLGGQMGADYQGRVSKYYAGRWGSWQVGIYNGAGYHAIEIDGVPVPEVRVTLRPLPDLIPGLQVSYFGLYGTGNTEYDTIVPGRTVAPLYQVNLGMLSYQNAWITFTGQVANTHGNAKGNFVVPGTPLALEGQGFSLFFNTKLPLLQKKLNLFARWDRFDPDVEDRVTDGAGDDSYDLVIGGVAWEFFPHWYLLAAYQETLYQRNSGGVARVPEPGLDLPDAWQAQLVMQMSF